MEGARQGLEMSGQRGKEGSRMGLASAPHQVTTSGSGVGAHLSLTHAKQWLLPWSAMLH